MPDVGRTPEEEESLAIVQRTVVCPTARGGLAWIFRRLPNPDYGIDGHIETIDPPAGNGRGTPTGRLISVQVKGGTSWFRHEHADHWVVYIEKDTVNYWRSHSLPVILVLVDLETERCYWVRADCDHRETNASYAIEVPKCNVLGATGAEPLRELADDALPLGSRVSALLAYLPIMRRVANGDRLLVRAVRYGANGDFLHNVSLAFELDILDYQMDVVWETDDATDDINELFPWATLVPAFDDADPYDEYLSEECPWDSEDGVYIDVGHYDEWLERHTNDDGSVLFNGQIMPDGGERYEHQWEIVLSQLGGAFLSVCDYAGLE